MVMICPENKKLSLVYALFLIIGALFSECKKTSPKEAAKETGTVTDRQGNVYNTIKIGNQWWMVENLKVQVYNDSTPLIEVKPTEHDSVWANKKSGAFCNLDIDSKRYGLHYNWHAVNDSRKIAPAGWHVPTDTDWKILEQELGMSGEEADNSGWRGTNESEKLIPESSTGWPSSLVFGTNESGFTALPGGCKIFNGKTSEVSATGYWWTASGSDYRNAWYRNISSGHNTIFRYYTDRHYGFNIRCVKD